MKTKTTDSYRSIIKNRPVYVAPANPAGLALMNELKAAQVEVLGLFDNLKIGEGISNHKESCPQNALVVVCDNLFQQDICLALLAKGFTPKDILCQQPNGLKPYRRTLTLRWQQAKKRVIRSFVTLFTHFLPRRKHVYYTEGFIDTNLLLAWRYHQKTYPNEAVLLGRNITHIPPDLASLKGVVCNQPIRAFWHLIQARSLVLDHEFHGLVFDTVRQHVPVTQMFHGLPLKHLAGNKHFPHINDLNFVSSSAWVNEHVFSHIFRAQNFHALGYPRNDALTQNAQERDWITAPSHARLEHIQTTTGPLIFYMPTFRDNGNNDYPLDYQALEHFCQQHHHSLILKFHPFVAQQLATQFGMAGTLTTPTQLPGFKHIYMFPPGMNAYPWLAEAELLITDYSSVTFDYLACKQPILLYQYDLNVYLANRGNFMIDISNFNLGAIAGDFKELEQKLLELTVEKVSTNNWQQQTHEHLGLVIEGASTRVVELIRQRKTSNLNSLYY